MCNSFHVHFQQDSEQLIKTPPYFYTPQTYFIGRLLYSNKVKFLFDFELVVK